MNDLELELEKLKDRMRQAKEYYKTKYDTDTPENKALADAKVMQMKKRIDEIVKQMSVAVEISIDTLEDQIKQYKAELMNPVKIDCYRKSKKLMVHFEPMECMKWAETKIIDE